MMRCAHCDGTGRCNCDECRNDAGLNPSGINKVVCKACGGTGGRDGCAHCGGSQRCNCDECRDAAGLDPAGSGYVRCKVCG